MTTGSSPSAGAHVGVVPAIVTRNDDKDKLGRVRVRYPWMGAKQESDWLYVAGPAAGAGHGLYFVPEQDDLVLVAFAFGRTEAAYVIGSLFSAKDKPPVDSRHKRTIKSASGHVITLDDTKDAESITIEDRSGKNRIVLDAHNDTVTIESGGALTIRAAGALRLESDKDIDIHGRNVRIVADQHAGVKGSDVAVKGSGGVTINDGALEVI